MPLDRRQLDRRRRVLYSSARESDGQAGLPSPATLAKLRAARRPVAVYGERVQRRLAGRWFSLVPVRRRTFTLVSGAIAAITAVLVVAVAAAEYWPPLANRETLTRPLRLDRVDSLGNFLTTTLLMVTAGVALLTYQLRRYRLDDYQGQYRLWRLVLVLMVLAGIQNQADLIAWGGAVLDTISGRRVALSGADWLALLTSVGGAIVCMRVIVDVRACKLSVAGVLAAAGFVAVPQAVRWNVLSIQSPSAWVLLVSAPLLATTALLIGLSANLRMVYREVCEIDDAIDWRSRWGWLKARLLPRRGGGESPAHQQPAVAERSSGRRSPSKLETDAPDNTDASGRSGSAADNQTTTPKRRGWFDRLRRKPGATKAAEDSHAAAEVPVVTTTAKSNRSRAESVQADTSDDDAGPIDSDEIDWDSLSKAQRRRMRKQLKRQGRAA